MYKIVSIINNIDKLMGLMRKCAKERDFVGQKGLLDISEFAGYSKVFFREIDKLPECFYGDEEGMLDIDEIYGLSVSSRRKFTTAIISRSQHAKEYVKSYLEQYESLVEKIHGTYLIIGQDLSSPDDFAEVL